MFGSANDIAEQEESMEEEDKQENQEDDLDEKQQKPPLNYKMFMKSQLYKEMSFGYGHDNEEDDAW